MSGTQQAGCVQNSRQARGFERTHRSMTRHALGWMTCVFLVRWSAKTRFETDSGETVTKNPALQISAPSSFRAHDETRAAQSPVGVDFVHVAGLHDYLPRATTINSATPRDCRCALWTRGRGCSRRQRRNGPRSVRYALKSTRSHHGHRGRQTDSPEA